MLALLASGLGAAVIVLLLRRSSVLAMLALLMSLVLSEIAVRLVLTDDEVYDVAVPSTASATHQWSPMTWRRSRPSACTPTSGR